MNRVIVSAAALALAAACAGPQSAPTAESAAADPDAPAAEAAEGEIVTETGRWETEGSRDTLVRLKGPVGGWTSSRR